MHGKEQDKNEGKIMRTIIREWNKTKKKKNPDLPLLPSVHNHSDSESPLHTKAKHQPSGQNIWLEKGQVYEEKVETSWPEKGWLAHLFKIKLLIEFLPSQLSKVPVTLTTPPPFFHWNYQETEKKMGHP